MTEKHEGNANVAAADAAPVVPLAKVGPGQEAILSRVDGGRGLLLRLTEMGIRPGVRFRVLNRGRPGPFIVLLGATRLVIGQGMVHRMFVRVAGLAGAVGAGGLI